MCSIDLLVFFSYNAYRYVRSEQTKQPIKSVELELELNICDHANGYGSEKLIRVSTRFYTHE